MRPRIAHESPPALGPAAGKRRWRAVLLWVVAIGVPSMAAAHGGAAASPDRYGADTAAQILAAGGNAVDATVAMAFTLAVTYPEAGNLGGGGFATIRFGNQSYFLDYRETAPASATADMYLDAHGEVIPGASTIGSRAAGVPGTVMGLWELHRRFGTQKWSRLLQPAIRYAREGFIVSAQLQQRSDETLEMLHGRTNFARYFGSLKAGAALRQPELAATLERIARDGAREFYHGRTARLLVAQMERDHGSVSAADLAGYRARWREPLEADWAGYRVVTAPPPSSGGIGLIALLKMKAAAEPLFSDVAFNSAQYVHLLAELQKRVFADRAAYLGDPYPNAQQMTAFGRTQLVGDVIVAPACGLPSLQAPPGS